MCVSDDRWFHSLNTLSLKRVELKDLLLFSRRSPVRLLRQFELRISLTQVSSMLLRFHTKLSCAVLLLLLLTIVTPVASFVPIKVTCEINGFRIPAIIDTGAEVTVMSTSCAKRCHLLNQIDTQHCGEAIGVGSDSSEIVGGIERLGMRIGPLNFMNKLSVLRNSRCDLILGLDVLRRFNGDISLRDRTLKLYVRGEKVTVPFLDSEREQQHHSFPPMPHRADFNNEDGTPFNQNNHRSFDNYDEYDDDWEESIHDSGISMEGV
jgi:hypothetical protein